jgi:hypothetical protein
VPTLYVTANIICAFIVLVRTICLASHLRYGMWPGQMIRFAAFSCSIAGLGASAFSVAFDLPHAGDALLTSITGVLIFDRRRIGMPRSGH